MVEGHDGSSVSDRIDRSCKLLGSSYRRYVVYALRRQGSASVGELADALVAEGVASERERAAASLVHTHLPKLAEFGAVEYDDPDDGVSLADDVDELEPFLTAAARRETDGQFGTADAGGPGAVAEGELD